MPTRRSCVFVLVLALALAFGAPSAGTSRQGGARPFVTPALSEPKGTLFENVAAVLGLRLVDRDFRAAKLPALVREYTEKALKALPLDERGLVHEFLGRIPLSHLGLLSAESHVTLMNDLRGVPSPTVGFQVVGLGGEFYVWSILEGGPAQVAGLLPWDRVVTIDGTAVKSSPRLDWRTDDAALPDDRDPPIHFLKVSPGETVRLTVERRRGESREISVPVADYSAMAAARASVRVVTRAGTSIGYVHFPCISMSGVPDLLREVLDGQFASCDGVVIDLRGRGGSGSEVAKAISILKARAKKRKQPLVALIDRQTRSAKEVFADELKSAGLATLVGERTAGAVVGAAFVNVGHGCVLMVPVQRLPAYTPRLEGKGIEPDVPVERAGPQSGGADPILDAGLAQIVRLAERAGSTKRLAAIGRGGPTPTTARNRKRGMRVYRASGRHQSRGVNSTRTAVTVHLPEPEPPSEQVTPHLRP